MEIHGSATVAARGAAVILAMAVGEGQFGDIVVMEGGQPVLPLAGAKRSYRLDGSVGSHVSIATTVAFTNPNDAMTSVSYRLEENGKVFFLRRKEL